MNIAEVTRRYGLHHAVVRNMIEYGYKWHGTAGKLDATRTGARWDVTQESLDRWAALEDAHNLTWALEAIDERTAAIKRDDPADDAPGFLQLALMCPQSTRRSFDRLVAAGQLGHETIRCTSSGMPWQTYFRPGRPPVGSAAASSCAVSA